MTRPASAVQDAPYGANLALDLVIDRVREAPGKHPMEPPNLDVDACVQCQRIDIRNKRVQEVVSQLFAVQGVELPASIKVPECGWQDPQTHRSLSEFALRVAPVHGLLSPRLVALLRLFQGLLMPGGRFVPVTLACNGVPELLERAELLFPGHAFNRGGGHASSLLGGRGAGKPSRPKA